MEKFTEVNGVQLHYFDYGGSGPALVMLPGLTANAAFFEGVIKAGLKDKFRVIAVDLRGRGKSSKPATGYSMADHAADIIALADHLGLEKFILAGHSFGGLIGFVLGAGYPDRVSKMVIADASILLVTERTRQMIKASLDRLKARIPSMDAYIGAMKNLGYLDGFWDAAIEKYYRSDVEILDDGSVRALASASAVDQTIDAEFEEDWDAHIAAIQQPVLLLNALGAFGPPGTPPLMPKDMAEETAASLADCIYLEVPGNHITMFFGNNAQAIVKAIQDFAGN